MVKKCKWCYREFETQNPDEEFCQISHNYYYHVGHEEHEIIIGPKIGRIKRKQQPATPAEGVNHETRRM